MKRLDPGTKSHGYLTAGASGFVAGHLIEHIVRNDPEKVTTYTDLVESWTVRL